MIIDKKLINKYDWISKVNWSELAKDWGTPVYVYNEEYIKRRANYLKALFSDMNVELFYAMKANTNIDLLKILANQDYGLEGVSKYEIMIGLKIIEDRKKLMFTSCCLDNETLSEITNLKVRVNADSWAQLNFLLNIDYENIGVRLDLGYGEGHHSYTKTGGTYSKFGIEMNEFILKMKNININKIHRIHFHLGSGIKEPKPYIRGLYILWNKILKKVPISEIDIGGGFGYPYKEGDKEFDFDTLKKELILFSEIFEKTHGLVPKFILEPGRWLVAGGGVLLAKVTDIKKKKEKIYVALNTGMQHFIRPSLYRSYHEVIFLTNEKPRKYVKGFVVGNSCENSDIMPEERTIPSNLNRDDLVLILDTGAYGYVMSSNYNSYPKPMELIIREDGVIKKTMSYDEFLKSLL